MGDPLEELLRGSEVRDPRTGQDRFDRLGVGEAVVEPAPGLFLELADREEEEVVVDGVEVIECGGD